MSQPEDISPELIAADKILSDAWKAHDADFNPASNSISDGLWGKFVNAIAAAILAAKAEERDALLTLLAEAEDWDLGAFKDKGADYLIQSVQSRMFIRLDEAIRARGIEVNTAHKNSEEV